MTVWYEFAVDIRNQESIHVFAESLLKNPLVTFAQFNFDQQTLLVASSLAPSDLTKLIIITTIAPTVLRGVAAEQGHEKQIKTAAVCIFEHFPGVQAGNWAQFDNKGVCRMIQTDTESCLIDLIVDGLYPNHFYSVNINEYGDISQGASSTGSAIKNMGSFRTDRSGSGKMISDIEMEVGSIIGRSMVLSSSVDSTVSHEDAVCGIIARSAGLFENVKKVCSCSGKTMWEESTQEEPIFSRL